MAQDPLILPHPIYLAMGTTSEQRGNAYRTWLHAPLNVEELTRIRGYLAQEKALGDARFQGMVEKALNRPAAYQSRGRPRKAETEAI